MKRQIYVVIPSVRHRNTTRMIIRINPSFMYWPNAFCSYFRICWFRCIDIAFTKQLENEGWKTWNSNRGYENQILWSFLRYHLASVSSAQQHVRSLSLSICFLRSVFVWCFRLWTDSARKSIPLFTTSNWIKKRYLSRLGKRRRREKSFWMQL